MVKAYGVMITSLSHGYNLEHMMLWSPLFPMVKAYAVMITSQSHS